MPILKNGGFCSVISVHFERRLELVEKVELTKQQKKWLKDERGKTTINNRCPSARREAMLRVKYLNLI